MSRALLLAVVATVLLAMCVSAASVQPLHESEYQSHFTGFVKKFTKKYAHDEFFPRYAIFKANLNKIREHNQSGASYSMAVNEFADMSWEEFHAKMTGLRAVDNAFLRSKNGPHMQVQANADSLDWRAKGAVTPVKNQQSCGSCWAFSATGSMEGAIAVKTGQLLNLSEQQLVDCSRAQGNHGCNGGLMDYAFQYVMTNGGITSQDQYPYTARDESCKRNVTSVATISSFVDVAAGSETALMNAVNLHPVSVAIAASPSAFQFYSGGVLDDASCGSRLDHGVTLVGYGTDSSLNKEFWILKNSWGTGWGESGYVRFVRGKNQCGVANMASYPIA